jgi:hypothetical protein
MDFPAEVNDNGVEPKSCLFKMSMGKQAHQLTKPCDRSAQPDQGTVSDPNHYDQKASNRQADA